MQALALCSCSKEGEKSAASTATKSTSAKSASAKPASPSAKSADRPEPAPPEPKEQAATPEGTDDATVKKESPVPDIPDGRSKPPTVAEWQKADALNTQEPNSQPEKCEMKVVREWLKVYCYGDVIGFSDMFGFGEKQRDYFASLRKNKSADFVLRLRPGKTQKLRIQYETAPEAVLFVSWPAQEPKPTHIALGRGNLPEKKKEKKK